jgi:hypothetical protein
MAKDETTKTKDVPTTRPLLYLAEYPTTAAVVHAAERVRDAGYRKWDVHTPFPIHGMNAAMGIRDSAVGWIVLVMGLTGCASAFLLIWWTNGVDYPLVVGGKPPYSLPSMIPVMFELTILLSAFGAVFGMLGLNQLPKHHHPVFYSDRFERATDDRFFISIEASDPAFDREATRALLEETHPTHVELVQEEAA